MHNLYQKYDCDLDAFKRKSKVMPAKMKSCRSKKGMIQRKDIITALNKVIKAYKK